MDYSTYNEQVINRHDEDLWWIEVYVEEKEEQSGACECESCGKEILFDEEITTIKIHGKYYTICGACAEECYENVTRL